MSKPKISDIQRVTCKHFNIPLRDMLDQSRFECHREPRRIAMYLARKLTCHSFPIIATAFNRRYHDSVWHSNRRVLARVESGDPATLECLAAIEARLTASCK